MSLLATLEAAATLLECEARSMYESHTLRGEWTFPDYGAKRSYDGRVRVANELRRAAEYARPNPLGGPAKVFEACADAIRAGDDIDKAMAEYGLKWVKAKGK